MTQFAYRITYVGIFLGLIACLLYSQPAYADNIGPGANYFAGWAVNTTQSLSSPTHMATYNLGNSVVFTGFSEWRNPGWGSINYSFCLVTFGLGIQSAVSNVVDRLPLKTVTGTLTTTGSAVRCSFNNVSVGLPTDISGAPANLVNAIQTGGTVIAYAYTAWMEPCTAANIAMYGPCPPEGGFESNYAPVGEHIRVIDPNQAPVAHIDTSNPSYSPAGSYNTGARSVTVTAGAPLNINGHGTDSDGTINAYEWRVDGTSCTANGTVFNSQNLSPASIGTGGITFASKLTAGNHRVYYRVADDLSKWSTGCPYVDITVTTPSLAVCDNPTNLNVGETKPVYAWYRPNGAAINCGNKGVAGDIDVTTNPGTSWSSGDTAIASLVGGMGMSVNGVSSGGTTVTATYNTLSASANVNVAAVGVINGQCSATHYSCVTGSSISNGENATQWTWTCVGSGPGHTDAPCTELKSSPTPTLTVCPASIDLNIGETKPAKAYYRNDGATTDCDNITASDIDVTDDPGTVWSSPNAS